MIVLFILISSSLLIVFSSSSKDVTASNEGRELLLKKWKKGPFLPIRQDTKLSGAIAAFLISAKAEKNLSQEQQRGLAAGIQNLFLAYHDGSFESYVRFRLPNNTIERISWNEEAVQFARKEKLASKEQVEKYYKTIGKTLNPVTLSYLTNNYDTMKEYFQMTLSARVLGSRFSLFCARCWKAVDLDSAVLKIQWLDRIPESLGPEVLRDDNLGKHSPVSWFNYEHAAETVLASHGKVCIAELRFIARTDGVYEAYPVYVQWHWTPELGCWLPDELHAAVSNRDINYFF